MSKQLKANLLHALFVGIICGVLIGIYAALPIEQPLYWAAFIMIPTVFMFGGEWKDVPYHWVNAAIGLFLGGALTFVITQQLVPGISLPLAFAVATCICTFLVQGLTNGVFSPGGFKPFFGRCPMAFVGMGRGSLVDPHLPNKAKEGRLQDIRQCIGCLQACAGHTYKQIPTCCLVNPEVGKEFKYTFEPCEPKKVLIAGGGPGGMNAAIAAARRGHDVTLWEKEDRLGGQFIAAGCTPGKGDYITYVYSLNRTVHQLGVKVELNKEATADDVRAFGAGYYA